MNDEEFEELKKASKKLNEALFAVSTIIHNESFRRLDTKEVE